MSKSLFRSVVVLGSLLLATQAFAIVEMSLPELRKEVLDENLDIKIQYERYYQAQKGVSVALGQFLPGVNINMINVNATFFILQSIIPTPSKWFVYEASKELRVAEKFTTEAIKLNILEGLTINYVNLKYHDALLVSLNAQSDLLNEVYEDVKRKEVLGVANESDVFLARRNLLQQKHNIFSLNSLIIAEKQGLLIALNKDPQEELYLAPVPAENLDVIPTDVEAGAALAVNNSSELLSNSYQAEAAAYMVSSKKWSFVSFNGIGFDYGSNLSIERSRARVIALQGNQISLKIKNQVYSAYETLDLINQRIGLQNQVVTATRNMNARTAELYTNNAVPFSKYYDSKNDLSLEERNLVKLQMERSMKIAQLKRLLGLDSSLGKITPEQFESIQITSSEEAGRRGSKNVWISVEANEELLSQLFSVTYSVENLVDESRMLAGDTNLVFSFNARLSGDYKVKARIQMISGEIVNKELTVIVK